VTRRPKYKLYLRLMILSAVMLVVAMTVTSFKIIQAGRHFTHIILEEHETLLANTLRFGHGVMIHMGVKNYDALIKEALKSRFVFHLAILDDRGNVIAQSTPPLGVPSEENYDLTSLADGRILKEKQDLALISYRAPTIAPDEVRADHHATLPKSERELQKPAWFVVGVDTSRFERHFRDMVFQTAWIAGTVLLLGGLIILFFGIIQRYELAHLSIERLNRIKRILGHFVPETAKTQILNHPEKKALLEKYIQDATVLFLDIEGFTLFLKQYSQERINRVIEHYFSVFFDLIHKNGGDINETAGDGMMVIFLNPDPGRHAENAVRTALEIKAQCLRISEKGSMELFPIQINAGIESGDVYLGSTKMRRAEDERWTFTASGAVTIKAARLAQFADGGRILVGEETARRIQRIHNLIPIGKVDLKNLEDSGEVYEVAFPHKAG